MQMRTIAIGVLFAALGSAKVDVTKVAAVSTIAVNVLEIRQTIRKARVVAQKSKAVVVKAAKKVAGK